MEKQKFVIGKEELEKLYEVEKNINSIAVTDNLIRNMFKHILYLEATVETLQTVLISSESSLLTQDQKVKAAELLNKNILKLAEQPNSMLQLLSKLQL